MTEIAENQTKGEAEVLEEICQNGTLICAMLTKCEAPKTFHKKVLYAFYIVIYFLQVFK